MLDIYAEVIEGELAIPVFKGEKTPSERFAGAERTYSVEAMMQDTKAVQAGTSHYMGTKFAEAFDIKYLNSDNEHVHAFTTSWGVSTRLIGAMIMSHGDDQGLVMPPKVAPQQVVFIPVGPWQKNPAIMDKIYELNEELASKQIRTVIDGSDNRPGYKFNEWELRGAPLRVEIGPRDLENNKVIVKARDLNEKVDVEFTNFADYIENALDEMQNRLLESARERNSQHIYTDINTLEELENHIEAKKAAERKPRLDLSRMGRNGRIRSED